MLEWSQLAARQERNDLPAILGRAIINEQITPEQARVGVIKSWGSAEWPARSMSTEVWSMVFDYANPDASKYIDDDADDYLIDKATLPDTLKLYRGCSAIGMIGWSWSTSLHTASWFAHRFRGEALFGDPDPTPIVFEIDAPSDWVIARVGIRGEGEYILDVNELAEGEHLIRTVDVDPS